MKGLTEKQRAMLDFIEEFMNSVGMAPTVYEIAEHFRIKTSTVFAHIRALQRKNCLTRSSKARSIALTKPKHRSRNPSGLRSIPVLNDPLDKKAVRQLFCDAAFIGSGPVSDVRNLYALRIRGEELRDLGIRSGDLAIIRKHPQSLKPGDIVLTEKDGGTAFRACSRVCGDEAELTLSGAGGKTEHIYLPDLPLSGVVIGVQRSL